MEGLTVQITRTGLGKKTCKMLRANLHKAHLPSTEGNRSSLTLRYSHILVLLEQPFWTVLCLLRFPFLQQTVTQGSLLDGHSR